MPSVVRPRHAAATDAQVRELLAECLAGVEDLTDRQRTSLTEELLPAMLRAVRIKRPIWRPADWAQRDAARKLRINKETREKATHHAQPYTDSEIETLMRDDLTDQQIAEALGRSFYAVKTKRKKLRAADRSTR